MQISNKPMTVSGQFKKKSVSELNKLASLEATLVRNYDSLTYPLTDRGKV